MTQRPDGKRLMCAGKLTFLLGLISFIANQFRALWPEMLDYHAAREIISLLGVLGIFLGAVSWMVGYLAFAISFVRGRADP